MHRLDGRNILHTPSILRILKVFWYYPEYSQYSQHQYSQHQPDEILPVLGSTRSTWQYPQCKSLKYLKYSSIPQAGYSTVVVILRVWSYPQYTISKYVLRVAVSEVFSLGNTFLPGILRGTVSICESIHSQIDGPSSGRSSKSLSR